MTRNPLPNRNPILAFDSQQLARIHDAAKDRAIGLRQAEFKAFRNRIFAALQSGLRRLGLR